MVTHTHGIIWCKVEKWKAVKISWFNHQEWLEIVQYFIQMGVEEMMSNCVFSKMQVNQTPYLYCRVSLIWASKYYAMRTNAHKMSNQMAPKSDPK